MIATSTRTTAAAAAAAAASSVGWINREGMKELPTAGNKQPRPVGTGQSLK